MEWSVQCVVSGKVGGECHHAEEDVCGCVDVRTKSRGRRELAAGRQLAAGPVGGVLFC